MSSNTIRVNINTVFLIRLYVNILETIDSNQTYYFILPIFCIIIDFVPCLDNFLT